MEILKSKKLQVSIIALCGVVFNELFHLELTTNNLHQIAYIAVSLVVSYGVEDFIAILRKSAKHETQTLYQSKRFWIALAGVATVMVAPEQRDIVYLVIALISGVSLPELAQAGKASVGYGSFAVMLPTDAELVAKVDNTQTAG